jgi:hypothetical protein
MMNWPGARVSVKIKRRLVHCFKNIVNPPLTSFPTTVIACHEACPGISSKENEILLPMTIVPRFCPNVSILGEKGKALEKTAGEVRGSIAFVSNLYQANQTRGCYG